MTKGPDKNAISFLKSGQTRVQALHSTSNEEEGFFAIENERAINQMRAEEKAQLAASCIKMFKDVTSAYAPAILSLAWH